MSNFNGLEITEINITEISNDVTNQVAAKVRFVFNDVFVIAGVKIVRGKFGLFISMPRSYDAKEGKGQNYAFPITQAFHVYISEKIMKEYNTIKSVA